MSNHSIIEIDLYFSNAISYGIGIVVCEQSILSVHSLWFTMMCFEWSKTGPYQTKAWVPMNLLQSYLVAGSRLFVGVSSHLGCTWKKEYQQTKCIWANRCWGNDKKTSTLGHTLSIPDTLSIPETSNKKAVGLLSQSELIPKW